MAKYKQTRKCHLPPKQSEVPRQARSPLKLADGSMNPPPKPPPTTSMIPPPPTPTNQPLNLPPVSPYTFPLSTILITDARGYLSAHIIDKLLCLGHIVIGTVRNKPEAREILRLNPQYRGKIAFTYVPDAAASKAWDKTFQTYDVDYVILVPGKLVGVPRFGAFGFMGELMRISRQGVIGLLVSASMYGKSVKRVVIAGSIESITTGTDIGTRVLDSKHWLPITIEQAIASRSQVIQRCVAKAQCEQTIIKYFETMKPSYTFTILVPGGTILGPSMHCSGLRNMPDSSQILYRFFNGTPVVPDIFIPSYIDVRDLSNAHILALINPSAANKRFILHGHPYNTQMITRLLQRLPQTKDRVGKESGYRVSKINWARLEVWNKKLGVELLTLARTIADTTKFTLKVEAEEKRVKEEERMREEERMKEEAMLRGREMKSTSRKRKAVDELVRE